MGFIDYVAEYFRGPAGADGPAGPAGEAGPTGASGATVVHLKTPDLTLADGGGELVVGTFTGNFTIPENAILVSATLNPYPREELDGIGFTDFTVKQTTQTHFHVSVTTAESGGMGHNLSTINVRVLYYLPPESE